MVYHRGVRSPPGAVARIALAAAVACAFSAASRAVAAPLSAELSVERRPDAEDCPDVASLSRIVERIVSADASGPLVHAGGEVRAAVRFSRDAGIYRAALLLAGKREGERTLTDTGPTCTALGRAVGITLALLLDAGLDARPDRPATAAPTAVVVTPAAPSAVPTAPRSTEGTLAVTVGPALGLVGAPALATGVAFVVGVKRRAVVSLDGQYVAPRATALDEGEVDVALLSARLRLCGVLSPEAVIRVGACAAGAAGALRGEGRGYAAADTARTQTWLAAGGGLEATAALGHRLRAGVAADALAPLRKSTFSIANRGVAYQSSPVSVMLAASLGVVLW
jgi:hypothetical protein